jgi:uncharacterized membrane protein
LFYHYIILALIFIFVPYLCYLFTTKNKLSKFLSPVVLAYIFGIIVGNLKLLQVEDKILENIAQASVVLALPLLLYSTNFKVWISHARNIILSFSLSVLSAIVGCIFVVWLFKNNLTDHIDLAAMYLGGIVGGTPNLQSIGIAIDADENSFILLNAADIVVGGIYLILLTSIWKRLLLTFLPEYKYGESDNVFNTKSTLSRIYQLVGTIGLTSFILVASVGLSVLIFAEINSTFVILLLTTLSVAFSFIPAVRSIPFTYSWGEYLLLAFCIAIGLLADFRELISEGGMVVLFVTCMLLVNVLLHLVLSRIFKIDADTTIIMNVAAVYGPVFVGQVASAINNRELIFPGIASSLVGLAVGNYIGILFYSLMMS